MSKRIGFAASVGMKYHAVSIIFFNHFDNVVCHDVGSSVQKNPGIHFRQGTQEIILIQVLHGTAPSGGIGIGHQAGGMGSKLIGQPSQSIPDRQVIPDQTVFFFGQHSNPLGNPVFHFRKQRFIKIHGNLCSTQGNNHGKMEKCIKTGHGRGTVHGGIQNLLPESLPLDG